MMKKGFRRAVGLCLLVTMLVCSLPVSAAFRDVPADHWAADAIRYCTEKGIFQGQSATTFGVNAPLTRSAAVVVLNRVMGWQSVADTAPVYTDVPASAAYFKAVQTAYANGALTASTPRFRPNDPVTREELSVMLVRSLGYTGLAGVVQELKLPFEDVVSNRGYIAMAYELGLVSGTTPVTFAPKDIATRDQAAVMFARLHERLSAALTRTGVLYSAKDLPSLEGYEAVGIAAARLMYQQGKAVLTTSMSTEEVSALRAAAGGIKQLLYVNMSENPLRGNAAETAALLSKAAASYDGLFLDAEKIASQINRKSMTALAAAVRKALGTEKTLYIGVEAPSWQGRAYNGYDYGALAAKADRLVVRISPTVRTEGDFPVSPVASPEEVYYALEKVSGQVPPEKLMLEVSSEGVLWKNATTRLSVSGTELAQLLEEPSARTYYSDRYACAYLTAETEDEHPVAWYLNPQAVAQISLLCALMDVDHLCFTRLDQALPDVVELTKPA